MANDLGIVISYIGMTLQVVTIQKFLVLLFDNEIDKLCALKLEFILLVFYIYMQGAAVADWLSSWLAEQEDQGSIQGFATWIFRDLLSSASKSRYGWNTTEAT